MVDGASISDVGFLSSLSVKEKIPVSIYSSGSVETGGSSVYAPANSIVVAAISRYGVASTPNTTVAFRIDDNWSFIADGAASAGQNYLAMGYTSYYKYISTAGFVQIPTFPDDSEHLITISIFSNASNLGSRNEQVSFSVNSGNNARIPAITFQNQDNSSLGFVIVFNGRGVGNPGSDLIQTDNSGGPTGASSLYHAQKMFKTLPEAVGIGSRSFYAQGDQTIAVVNFEVKNDLFFQ